MQPNQRHSNPLGRYILKDRIPIPCPDFEAWAQWLDANDRFIAQDAIGHVLISTIFLGLDRNFMHKGPPLLFETARSTRDRPWMVMERYSTWELALEGHRRHVSKQNRGF